MITLRDVGLEIGGRRLIGGLDANIRAGEFVAILGPNGVGKTTLLRAITALHPHVRGEILLLGDAIGEISALERARRIAFVTSDDALTDALGVREVVAIGRFPHHRWWEWNSNATDDLAIARALEAVGMSGFSDRLFSSLSSGERQRIWIAMGLAQETPILMLDEPTSHLDVRVAHTILALLRKLSREGKSVVCVLHDLNEAAAYADRIMLLGCERLLSFGHPDTVLASDVVEEAYGVAMERVQLPDGRLRIFASDTTGTAPS